MSILGPVFLCIIIGSFLFFTALAIASSIGNGRDSRDEEQQLYRSRTPANQN